MHRLLPSLVLVDVGITKHPLVIAEVAVRQRSRQQLPEQLGLSQVPATTILKEFNHTKYKV